MLIKALKILVLIFSVCLIISSGYYLYNAYLPEISFALTPANVRENEDLMTTPSDNAEVEETEIPFITTVSATPEPTVVCSPTPIPKDNRIVIPKINVDAPITEGTSSSALDHGMWRRPDSSTPDKGGNTVITGHRVLRTTGPNTFYFLNKVAVNDEINIYWKGKEFIYKIYSIKVVNSDQVEVENQTKDSIITLYTCTPAWTSKYRLVVKAKLK